MNSQLREKTIKLRLEENLSYTEIGKRLDVPKSTLSYWLKDFPLSEERIKELRRQGWSKGEASRERFRATMRRKKELKAQKIYQKQLRKLEDISEDAFFVAGLMLYLGEGGKKDDSKITLANTDPSAISFFVKWMSDFLDIPKQKTKFQLHLYEDMDIVKEEDFWRNELGIQKTQFYKTQIRRLQKASFTYKESYRHGTCSVYALGVDKKTELMMGIKAFIDKYKEYTKGM